MESEERKENLEVSENTRYLLGSVFLTIAILFVFGSGFWTGYLYANQTKTGKIEILNYQGKDYIHFVGRGVAIKEK